MTKTGKMIGAGIGLTAIAAVGTYFLYGKRGAQNREKIAGWSGSALGAAAPDGGAQVRVGASQQAAEVTGNPGDHCVKGKSASKDSHVCG